MTARGKRAGIAANLAAQIPQRPGVEALFADSRSRDEMQTIATAHGWRLADVPLRQIEPDPDQPRPMPLPDDLAAHAQAGDVVAQKLLRELTELADSIRQNGVLQPIIVYAINNDRYRIYKGQRRWHATTIVGLDHIPAVIVPPPGAVQKLIEQVDENVQRAELSPISQAVAMVTLRDALKRDGGTLMVVESGVVREVALPAGKDVPWRVIEAYFRVGESRRKQLLDLLLLDDAVRQRAEMAGLGEYVLRPVIDALKEDKEGEWLTPQVQMEVINYILDPDQSATSEKVRHYLEAHQERRRADERKPAPATARNERATFVVRSVDQLTKYTTYLKRLPVEKEYKRLSQTERQKLRDAATHLMDEARDLLRQLDADAPR